MVLWQYLPMGIAADIQRELDKRGLTIYKFAKGNPDIEEKTLDSIIRNDSNPRIDTIIPIARAFGITVDELVNNPEPVRKVSRKPMSPKDLKKILLEYGVGPDDVRIVMDNIGSIIKNRQLKERRSGNGEAEEPVA